MKGMIQILITTVFAMILFSSCKSTGQISPKQYKGKKIEFGSGGGFSGAVKSYTLLDDGTLFENIAFKDSSAVLLKVDKNTVAQIFANYEVLNLSSLSLNDPGNMYKFVNFKDADKEQNLIWTGNSVDKNLNLFYNILKSVITD